MELESNGSVLQLKEENAEHAVNSSFFSLGGAVDVDNFYLTTADKAMNVATNAMYGNTVAPSSIANTNATTSDGLFLEMQTFNGIETNSHPIRLLFTLSP